MPVLKFGPYQPDTNDLNAVHTQNVLNVLSIASGYGPFPSLSAFSSAAVARIRGAFFGRNSDGSVAIFAGTSTKLYRLDNTTLTWADVSKALGTYSALSADAHWQFVQFNSVIIAVHANAPPQAFTLGSSSEFADLGGSPPQAAFVAVVNRFVVLSGLLSFPRRIQWSGLNAITTWTSTVNFSDFQDLPDGGNAKNVVGGEYGIILQDTAIRRLIFQAGADVIFSIDRIAKEIGVRYPHSVIDAGGTIYFNSTKGFVKMDPSGGITPIGKERVDRTFGNDHDSARPDLIIGAADPNKHTVLFAYKSTDFVMDAFNKILAYDSVLDRWSPIELQGEYITSLARPGITLESLDTIGAITISNAANNGSGLIRLTVTSTSGWTTGDIKVVANVGGVPNANGTFPITVINATTIDLQGSTFAGSYTSGGYVAGSLDTLIVSLDDLETATLGQLAAFNTSHQLGFFTGTNLEATLTTAEQSGIKNRLWVSEIYPITDAATVYGSVGRRETLNATPSYTTENLINSQGMVPVRADTRHARIKLRIPSGVSWTHCSGVDPTAKAGGSR